MARTVANKPGTPTTEADSASFRGGGEINANWFDLGAAATILLIYGILTRQMSVDWDIKSEVFLRLAIAIALAGAAFAAFRTIWRSPPILDGSWWKVGGNLDNPSWDDVRCMALGDIENDPVILAPLQRVHETQLRNVAAYTMLGGLGVEVGSWLARGPVIGRLLAERTDEKTMPEIGGVYWELSANLTALLALIAAVSSIYFTYRQLQAKVKADSRQAWIDKLRDRIARFIALANSEAEPGFCSDPHEFDHRRLEMELMLNPSEKDHRLLMYLSLRLAFYRSGDEAFRKIHDVRNITAAIERSPGYCREKWLELLGPIPPTKPKGVFEAGHSDLVGYTLRLAHVVLKREWERVKTTR